MPGGGGGGAAKLLGGGGGEEKLPESGGGAAKDEEGGAAKLFNGGGENDGDLVFSGENGVVVVTGAVEKITISLFPFIPIRSIPVLSKARRLIGCRTYFCTGRLFDGTSEKD